MGNFQSYKRNPVNEKYDAIVVGSGIGGMATAAILAKKGKKVLVLERHYIAGGFTHVFKRPGYEWDVGVHYIGEVHKEYTALRKIFDYVSEGQLEWENMGEVYDQIFFGDKRYDFVAGSKNFVQKLKEYFPDPKNQEAIDKYIDEIYGAAKAARGFFVEKAMPKIVSGVAGGFMRKAYLKYARRTTLEVLKDITDNKELIGVLTGQYGDYGLPPAQSSFAMHAMVVKHYLNGAAYPIGGSGRMAETILPIVEKAGGKVLVSADVSEVMMEGNKAVGVKMADGAEIRTDMVISNTGIHQTFKHLLPESVRKKHGLEEMLGKTTPSASHVCLYIGIKDTAENLGLTKANYWIYPDNYDHDEVVANYLKDPENSPLPVTYISFPSAKDPSWQERFPGTATIEIISLAPYDWFAKWEDGRWKKRGEEYDELKEKFSQRLLAELYNKEPQLKGKIDFYELSSPLSTRHFVNYEHGEIYGIDHTPDRFDLRFLKPSTPIKNFYLTGQDVATAGVGGALMGGVLTASAILKKNLMSEILN